MILFFCKELPAAATLYHFKGVKLCFVFFNDPFQRCFYLVKRNLFFQKRKSIVGKINDLHCGQWLVTCKNECFDVGYKIINFHYKLLTRELNVQECDATNVQSGNQSW